MARPLDNESVSDALMKASAGDQEAWRDIIDAYMPRVVGLLRAQCGNLELAEEIAQSTFCTIAEKIEQYTETGKFQAWLFRIAINRLRDEMRRRGRQARPVDASTLAGLAGMQEEETGPDQDTLDLLRLALGRLTDVDRKILHLRYAGGLSFRNIADVLEQPIGTVLARQHRALKKLRACFEEEHAPGDAREQHQEGLSRTFKEE